MHSLKCDSQDSKGPQKPQLSGTQSLPLYHWAVFCDQQWSILIILRAHYLYIIISIIVNSCVHCLPLCVSYTLGRTQDSNALIYSAYFKLGLLTPSVNLQSAMIWVSTFTSFQWLEYLHSFLCNCSTNQLSLIRVTKINLWCIFHLLMDFTVWVKLSYMTDTILCSETQMWIECHCSRILLLPFPLLLPPPFI